jgi:hypothetical protein
MLLLAAGMTLSSAIALVYSLFSRLSAALLLRVMSYNSIDVRDEGDVDEMMMEYMTALMQQAERPNERSQSRSMSHSSMKLSGGEGLPRLIVPLVIDEIFDTDSKVSGGNRTSTAAESMLLHPIGDNQISTTTLRTHDQVMRSDLDLQGKGGFTSGFAGATGQTTVSGVVNAILGHCAVDEERGCAQVFTVQRDRWGRCNAAAEHVVAQLRSINGSFRQAQRQTKREDTANTGDVRRVLGTPSSLEAGRGSSVSLSVHLISILYTPFTYLLLYCISLSSCSEVSCCPLYLLRCYTST